MVVRHIYPFAASRQSSATTPHPTPMPSPTRHAYSATAPRLPQPGALKEALVHQRSGVRLPRPYTADTSDCETLCFRLHPGDAWTGILSFAASTAPTFTLLASARADDPASVRSPWCPRLAPGNRRRPRVCARPFRQHGRLESARGSTGSGRMIDTLAAGAVRRAGVRRRSTVPANGLISATDRQRFRARVPGRPVNAHSAFVRPSAGLPCYRRQP